MTDISLQTLLTTNFGLAPSGYSGSRGNVGYTGSAGTIGVDGYTGSQGNTGFTGSRGTDGIIGVDGYTGSQGNTGFTGSAGSAATVYDTSTNSTGYLAISSGNTAQRSNSTPYGGLRYNTTTGYAEVYTINGWGIFGAGPPLISTVTPSTFNGESGTEFTIAGSNFTNDISVKFISNAGVEYTAGSISFINASEVRATTPQDFTVADEPLDVKVVQNSGQATKLDAIDCGGLPTWSTSSGSLGTYNDNGVSVSVTVTATDPDAGSTISYSVISGSLPSGITLNSGTGVISGTTPSITADTTYNFTIRATDNAGNTADRAFSFLIRVANYFGSGADGAGSF